MDFICAALFMSPLLYVIYNAVIDVIRNWYMFFDYEYLMYFIAFGLAFPVSWYVIRIIDKWTQP